MRLRVSDGHLVWVSARCRVPAGGGRFLCAGYSTGTVAYWCFHPTKAKEIPAIWASKWCAKSWKSTAFVGQEKPCCTQTFVCVQTSRKMDQ